MFICGTEFFWAEYGCWFCFGFVLVLLFRMCIVYLDIFEIVFWSFPIGWRMRGWFTMLFLMGFLMENVLFSVMMCISYSLSSRKSIRAMVTMNMHVVEFG